MEVYEVTKAQLLDMCQRGRLYGCTDAEEGEYIIVYLSVGFGYTSHYVYAENKRYKNYEDALTAVNAKTQGEHARIAAGLRYRLHVYEIWHVVYENEPEENVSDRYYLVSAQRLEGDTGSISIYNYDDAISAARFFSDVLGMDEVFVEYVEEVYYDDGMPTHNVIETVYCHTSERIHLMHVTSRDYLEESKDNALKHLAQCREAAALDSEYEGMPF